MLKTAGSDLDGRWYRSVEPEELLLMAGLLEPEEASAIMGGAFERVEHLVSVEEVEAMPGPETPGEALQWTLAVEVREARRVGGPEAAAYVEAAVKAAHAAILRRAVRWPRPRG